MQTNPLTIPALLAERVGRPLTFRDLVDVHQAMQQAANRAAQWATVRNGRTDWDQPLPEDWSAEVLAALVALADIGRAGREQDLADRLAREEATRDAQRAQEEAAAAEAELVRLEAEEATRAAQRAQEDQERAGRIARLRAQVRR